MSADADSLSPIPWQVREYLFGWDMTWLQLAAEVGWKDAHIMDAALGQILLYRSLRGVDLAAAWR